ncbi:MAG: sensor histidine kinase [Cellulosilyticaceae bacterium]
MLEKLRLHLTLICILVTGAILFTITMISLQLTESQLNERNHLAFESHLNTIAYQLQFGQTISHSWLAQMEVNNDLIISIKDNNHPLLFKGSWTPKTPRSELIELALNKSSQKYQFNLNTTPATKLHIESLFFELSKTPIERYRVAMAIIPSQTGSYSLILLQDMEEEIYRIITNRILFLSISLLGMLSLGYFSWWFSGRAIRPIKLNQHRQVQFIAAASHELKTPLAVIQMNASILENPNDTASSKPISVIHKECTRMSRLVEDLLLLATADAKTWSIHKSPIDLDTLLIDMMDTLLPTTHAKQQSLSINLPDITIPILWGDLERIEQVISILVDNAIHYVPIGGKITLSLESTDTSAIIKIIDNGPGISSIHKPHIFDRFYQVDQSRKDKNHYGLGLSIAKEIIHLHHGSITLKDTPGGGCTFVIKLPYSHN